MKHNVIAVYKRHDNAVAAIHELTDQHLPARKIGILSKLNTDDELELKSAGKAATGLAIGGIAGPVLGVLTGIGLFAIPGLGFLFGAGALVGAIAGLDFGLIGGGVLSALLLNGENQEIASIYEQLLHDGNTLVVFKGNEEENRKAYAVLEKLGTAEQINAH